MFCIRDFKFRVGEAQSGFIEHVLCDIGADCVEAATCGFTSDVVEPGRNVEQRGTRSGTDRSEQRIDGLPCHLADEGIVMRCLFGPACSLELLESLALLLA